MNINFNPHTVTMPAKKSMLRLMASYRSVYVNFWFDDASKQVGDMKQISYQKMASILRS